MPATDSFRLPDFIGVGPPRTATTWLHEVLSGHVGLPEGVKETDFFVWKYDKGLEWYADHFRNCSPDRPIGEFSPNNFAGAQARERIARDIPGCKIICTLREPVERTYSHYRKMREGEYFSGSFEECLENRPFVLKCSQYSYYLTDWWRHFGKENVLVLIQDDLKANPQDYLNRVCDFIRIPRIQIAKSTSQDRLVNAIPRLPRHPRVARASRIIRDRLQNRGDYVVVNLLKRIGFRDLLFSGGPPFKPLRADTDARLREFFRPDVETLEKMLGRDLSAWKTARRPVSREHPAGL